MCHSRYKVRFRVCTADTMRLVWFSREDFTFAAVCRCFLFVFSPLSLVLALPLVAF